MPLRKRKPKPNVEKAKEKNLKLMEDYTRKREFGLLLQDLGIPGAKKNRL